MLIDGHSIINRAFYGLPDLTNREGLHTNAILGFLNIMCKILEEEKPAYLAVAFDVHAPTFRHKMYDAYKGTRKPMPQELREQVPVLKELLSAMHIHIMELPGYEADDILGTVAKRSEAKGMEVSLVSGDRDLLQIATDHIKIRIPKTRMGKTEIEDYYARDVQEKYQVTPTEFIDLKALMGDTADNIPGVPKVGEKTATELIVKYHSVEGIYEHLEEITKKSIKESLANNRELADLSKTLATINIDSPLEPDYEELRVEDFYTKDSYPLFKKLEFKHYLAKFDAGSMEQKRTLPAYREVCGLSEVEAFFEALHKKAEEGPLEIGLQILATDLEQASKTCDEGRVWDSFLGMAISVEGMDSVYVAPDGFAGASYLLGKLQVLLAREELRLCLFDSKNQYAFFPENHVERRCFDVLIGEYLLNPLSGKYSVDGIAATYLQLDLQDQESLFGKKSPAEMLLIKEKEVKQYVADCAGVARMAATPIEKELEKQGMLTLMREIEMPLTKVLYKMQREGVRVNPRALKEYGEELGQKISQLEATIYQEAGEQFNINSPKQLGEILFEKQGLPGGKKTKTGYSTAAEVLEKLAPDYPLVAHILEYRGYAKLKSTYADGLSAFIGEDDRIHSTFQQTVTATGRLSSTDPNLQNIPMRTEMGRRIRKVFIPKEGYMLTDADYSQIELRILAHMADDQQLIEAYRMDQDIHRITASKVFHVPFEEVTPLQRRNAKAVNFGIVYGISSFGLSQDLDVSRKEAAEYIEQYFETYPDIKKFLDHTVKDAKEQGYATTMFGRRRPIPELASSNFMQRSFGERVAMNSPIQGSAADIMKIAMIRVDDRLEREQLKSRLILQVHDEIVVETAPDEVEQVETIIRDEMVHAANLAVRLEIDLHTGADWYEAK